MVVRLGLIRQLIVLLFCLLAINSTSAQTLTLKTVAVENQSLLSLWFMLQEYQQVAPPYAWIRPKQTALQQEQQRTKLLTNLQQLASQHPALAPSLNQWRTQLLAATKWREPGLWGPITLMTHYRKDVPVNTLAAIGACAVPNWIEIWSAQGVSRLPWQPGQHLSDLLAHDGKLHDTNADWAMLVLPWGEEQKHGIAAWNLDDAELLAGTRLVLAPPIDKPLSAKLTRALADYLAHLLPGDNCQQLKLDNKADHALD